MRSVLFLSVVGGCGCVVQGPFRISKTSLHHRNSTETKQRYHRLLRILLFVTNSVRSQARFQRFRRLIETMLTIYIKRRSYFQVNFLFWSPPWEVVRLQWSDRRLFRAMVASEIEKREEQAEQARGRSKCNQRQLLVYHKHQDDGFINGKFSTSFKTITPALDLDNGNEVRAELEGDILYDRSLVDSEADTWMIDFSEKSESQ